MSRELLGEAEGTHKYTLTKVVTYRCDNTLITIIGIVRRISESNTL